MAAVNLEPDEKGPQVPAADVKASTRDLALTVLAVIAVIAALRFAQVVLVPVVLAVLISYGLDPPVTALERLHVPRGLGATLLLALLFAGAGAGAYALREDANAFVEQLPRVAHEVGQLVQSRGRRSPVGKVQQAASEIEKAASAATTSPASPPRGVSRVQVEQPPLNLRDQLLAGSAGIFGLAAQIVVVVFLALYLLAAGDLFKRKLVKLAGPRLSSKKITLQILQDIDRQIAKFLLARAAISAVVGVATWVALLLLGLHHAALWGVAAGVLNTVPYAGPAIVAAAVAVAGFLQFGTVWMAVTVSAATVVITSLEGYLLTPWLTSRAAQMNAVAVFVGLLFFGWLWGAWGLLLAVPLMIFVKAVCDRIEDLQPIGELLGE
jgi:predicted PurR-regulated permease PerM